MTGIEHSLNIYLDKNIIAKITLVNEQLHLQYTEGWQQTGYALSPHLHMAI